MLTSWTTREALRPGRYLFWQIPYHHSSCGNMNISSLGVRVEEFSDMPNGMSIPPCHNIIWRWDIWYIIIIFTEMFTGRIISLYGNVIVIDTLVRFQSAHLMTISLTWGFTFETWASLIMGSGDQWDQSPICLLMSVYRLNCLNALSYSN